MRPGSGYRQYLDEQIAKHPELFPPQISKGYWLDGFIESKRQHIKTRRIFLKANRQAYQIRPDTMMPYMIGKTEAVEKGGVAEKLDELKPRFNHPAHFSSQDSATPEKGLYLRRYGVPYEGIAHMLGRTPMYYVQICHR